MSYRRTHASPPWQPPSPGHDPIDLEHRLTSLEGTVDAHVELHDEHRDQHSRLAHRMSLHEKAILAILAVLQVVLQDKWPLLADLLKGLRP